MTHVAVPSGISHGHACVHVWQLERTLGTAAGGGEVSASAVWCGRCVSATVICVVAALRCLAAAFAHVRVPVCGLCFHFSRRTAAQSTQCGDAARSGAGV
eukprot:CAMPEP_0181228060 /NCGR_PEP_ID=MMETSP1096-20121128/33140_1 /TAXON_ID=156174 ORGANISM="Chrysochromulina ericina, Strain CCMP281" /NCGR_SAMPLE_ID=MMETSP1096 /ASSEMBLY_ACC=CAM_ASM_000453 /LENGTH=99 /DNA_ID=CAMNT_0023321547 /DNA_START=236 /DNA_END=535 /DNA_ORIENTATION=-